MTLRGEYACRGTRHREREGKGEGSLFYLLHIRLAFTPNYAFPGYFFPYDSHAFVHILCFAVYNSVARSMLNEPAKCSGRPPIRFRLVLPHNPCSISQPRLQGRNCRLKYQPHIDRIGRPESPALAASLLCFIYWRTYTPLHVF
jgi:hypothetical protein